MTFQLRSNEIGTSLFMHWCTPTRSYCTNTLCTCCSSSVFFRDAGLTCLWPGVMLFCGHSASSHFMACSLQLQPPTMLLVYTCTWSSTIHHCTVDVVYSAAVSGACIAWGFVCFTYTHHIVDVMLCWCAPAAGKVCSSSVTTAELP